jgi:hypothetical protein
MREPAAFSDALNFTRPPVRFSANAPAAWRTTSPKEAIRNIGNAWAFVPPNVTGIGNKHGHRFAAAMHGTPVIPVRRMHRAAYTSDAFSSLAYPSKSGVRFVTRFSSRHSRNPAATLKLASVAIYELN